MAEAKIKHAEEFAPAPAASPVNSALPAGFPPANPVAAVEPALTGTIIPSRDELKDIYREFHAKHGKNAEGVEVLFVLMDSLGVTNYETMTDSDHTNLYQAILNYGK
jgi:hypothetical protein